MEWQSGAGALARRAGERCPLYSRKRPPLYWAVAPLAFIGADHFVISLFTNAPRYSGVRCSSGGITTPSFEKVSLMAGASSARTRAALSFFVIASGVPFGRKPAFQL